MDRGVPILYMQQALRKLSYFYPIKRVLPSGEYDKSTYEAVVDFEKYFNIFPTGQINNELYNKIHTEYLKVLDKENEMPNVNENKDVIMLFQVLNNLVSTKYENIDKIAVSGLLDDATINGIKNIQSIINSSIDGILTKEFLEKMIKVFL